MNFCTIFPFFECDPYNLYKPPGYQQTQWGFTLLLLFTVFLCPENSLFFFLIINYNLIATIFVNDSTQLQINLIWVWYGHSLLSVNIIFCFNLYDSISIFLAAETPGFPLRRTIKDIYISITFPGPTGLYKVISGLYQDHSALNFLQTSLVDFFNFTHVSFFFFLCRQMRVYDDKPLMSEKLWEHLE